MDEELHHEETKSLFIVTVCFGPGAITRGTADVAVDVGLICAVVRHLQTRVCTLNPKGRGLVGLYGGVFLQVGVEAQAGGWSPLANKVVRACQELVSGYAGAPPGELGASVVFGKVAVMYLEGGPTGTRKGRCACCPGTPLPPSHPTIRLLPMP